jgi:hypothetical protein
MADLVRRRVAAIATPSSTLCTLAAKLRPRPSRLCSVPAFKLPGGCAIEARPAAQERGTAGRTARGRNHPKNRRRKLPERYQWNDADSNATAYFILMKRITARGRSRRADLRSVRSPEGARRWAAGSLRGAFASAIRGRGRRRRWRGLASAIRSGSDGRRRRTNTAHGVARIVPVTPPIPVTVAPSPTVTMAPAPTVTMAPAAMVAVEAAMKSPSGCAGGSECGTGDSRQCRESKHRFPIQHDSHLFGFIHEENVRP